MDGRGRGQAASQQHIAVLYMLTVPANCSMVVGPDSESNMTKNIYIYVPCTYNTKTVINECATLNDIHNTDVGSNPLQFRFVYYNTRWKSEGRWALGAVDDGLVTGKAV